MLSDTIVAISTAINKGAIAIVRLSGDEAIEIVDRIFSKDLTKAESNTVTYGHIKDGDEIIDEVLVTVFRAPHTYTKEDIVEINTHGGIYVTRKVLNLCLAKGARLALNGEFTKRAYLNGRIDLAKAEAINDLILADDEVKHKSAIRALDGSIDRLIDPLLEEVMGVIGTIEVNIDYPEYDDVKVINHDELIPHLEDWLRRTNEMITKAERFRVIKDGLRTAIIGKPNVGKSSLLNALIKKDKAIVTDIAGTTRDLVEDTIDLGNVTLHLIDTAGIRKSQDVVEKIGIERSIKAAKEADLVILVLDASKEIDDEDRALMELIKDKRHLIVFNKTDIKEVSDGLAISAISGDVERLVKVLNDEFQDDRALIDEDVLNNERQIALMKKARDIFMELDQEAKNETALDLLSSELYSAYHTLSLISGKDYEDDLIDHLFRNFCLGK